jgi:manganese/zinc/iron transport system permease protein
MNDLWRLLTLQDGNTRVVLLGASLLGLASGLIGSLAVMRRRALVGDAVAHAALPGVCAAYFIVGDRNFAAFLAGALVFGILGVVCIALIRAYTRIKEDAAIGMVLSVFFGLGIVFQRAIQSQPSGNRAGLDGFIFGKAASMVRQDVWLIAAVAGLMVLAVAALFKEFRLLCFDREFAHAQGWPVLALDLTLMALICTCTVVGLPAVGVVLMAALLITPGVAARFWSDRLSIVVPVSGAIGLFCGLIGTALSAVLPAPPGSLSRGWATGPLITLVAAAIFILSMLAAPRRGLVADLFRRRALRRRILVENLLRAAYEASERGTPAATRALQAARSWNAAEFLRASRLAERRGLVEQRNGTLELTAVGKKEAAEVVRAHRLWELYLIERAGVAPDHVDRDADQIEHILPPDLLVRLEARLAQEGRLPASPHPIAPGNGGAA